MHYAFPAEVLLRTIVDRVSTVQHIALNGEEGLRDWKSNKLPSLTNRINTLFDFSEDEIQDIVRPHVKKLHQATHGNAARGAVNMVLESGMAKYCLGPNPTCPEQCDGVAMLVLTQLEIMNYFIDQLTGKIAAQLDYHHEPRST